MAHSKAFLAGGVSAATGETSLVAFTGALHLFFAGCLRTRVSAIDIAAIAMTANHDLAVATNAVVQTGALNARLLRQGEQREKAIMLELQRIRRITDSVA